MHTREACPCWLSTAQERSSLRSASTPTAHCACTSGKKVWKSCARRPTRAKCWLSASSQTTRPIPKKLLPLLSPCSAMPAVWITFLLRMSARTSWCRRGSGTCSSGGARVRMCSRSGHCGADTAKRSAALLCASRRQTATFASLDPSTADS